MKNSHIDVEKDHQILENIDFIKQSWRFIPKHLLVIKNQQKNGIQGGILKKLRDKDALYQQSTMEIINKNKNLYLSPIKDIQKIMKHFHKKFNGNDLNIEQFNMKKNRNKRRRKTQNTNKKRSTTTFELRGQNGQQLIQNKISKLLQLPTIKRANSQAQKIKSMNIMKSTKKQNQKNQILRKFQAYFNKEIDILDKTKIADTDRQQKIRNTLTKRKRLHTTID